MDNKKKNRDNCEMPGRSASHASPSKLLLTTSMLHPPREFNPAHAGREFILRSLLRYNNVHFNPRQLAARRLIAESEVTFYKEFLALPGFSTGKARQHPEIY